MPASKPRSCAALLVEAEQRLERRVVDGPPIRARRQRREDLARAGLVGAVGRGLADEDAPAARCVADAGGCERPDDRDRGDARSARPFGEQIVDSTRAARRDHRDAELLRPGRNLHARAVGVALEQREPLAVQRDLGRLGSTHGGQAEAAAGAPHDDLVLGVERERVLDEQAAASSERQAFDVAVLRHVARHRVRRDA